MFNLGFSELLILAVIGLLVLGPEQLPVVARKVARMLNQFKHMMDDAMSPVNEIKQKTQEQIDKVQAQVGNVQDQVNKTIDDAKPGPIMGMNDDKPRLDDE